jgi:hypothetical protein
VVTTTGNNGRQTFQKGLDFGAGQTDYFGNTGIIVRNPATTFATTLAGGAVTANRTLNLPVTTGTDTVATLGLAQTFTGGIKVTGFSSNEAGNKTSTYNATKTDDVIYADDSAGSVTINLPSASGVDGKTFTIKKISGSLNTVTIAADAGNTIDNATSVVLNNYGEKVQVQSNNHHWYILSPKGDDADSYRIRGTPATVGNRWFGPNTVAYTAVIGATPPSGSLWAYPFVVPKTIKVDQIGVSVSTIVAGSSCHLGIYTDNGNALPNTLVSGTDVTVATTGSAGLKSGAFTGTVILQGNNLYWLAINCSTTTTLKLSTIPVAAIPNVLGALPTGTAVASGTGYSATSTFGTLPTTYPSSGLAVLAVPPMEVVVHIAK